MEIAPGLPFGRPFDFAQDWPVVSQSNGSGQTFVGAGRKKGPHL
ncbi:MAG: hypothetical protein V3W31_04480 [Thermodesulfobacteriota bacterium]